VGITKVFAQRLRAAEKARIWASARAAELQDVCRSNLIRDARAGSIPVIPIPLLRGCADCSGRQLSVPGFGRTRAASSYHAALSRGSAGTAFSHANASSPVADGSRHKHVGPGPRGRRKRSRSETQGTTAPRAVEKGLLLIRSAAAQLEFQGYRVHEQSRRQHPLAVAGIRGRWTERPEQTRPVAKRRQQAGRN